MKRILVVLVVILFHPKNLVCQGRRENPRITVRVDSRIEFVITDPQGKRSGFNPIENTKFVEINDSYGVMSIDSEDPDIEAPPAVAEFDDDAPTKGTYSLTLFGTRIAAYRMSITMSRTLDDGDVLVIRGVIDSGQTQTYSFDYTPEVGKEYKVSKVIVSNSLRQDLEGYFKLNLLGGHLLFRDLSRRVSKYEEYEEKSNTTKAVHELVKLAKKLDEVYKKTIKGKSSHPNHFITEDAYRILKEDVVELMK
jgi:hypothetical protein